MATKEKVQTVNEYTDDEVPPLEDLTEAVEKFTRLNKLKTESAQFSDKVTTEDAAATAAAASAKQVKPVSRSQELLKLEHNDPVSSTSPVSENKKETTEDKKQKSFGGLKKGFLFSPSSTSSSNGPHKTVKVKDCEVEFVKPKVSAEDQLRFDEVQDAMKLGQTFCNNKDQWLTEDLLSRIQSDPKLCNQLTDPAMMSVIKDLQVNPAAAANKYKDDPKVSEFLHDFSALMGQHFESMSEKSKVTFPAAATKAEKPTGIIMHSPDGSADMKVHSSTDPREQKEAEEQRLADRLIGEPEIRDILLDSEVQQLLTLLRDNPEMAQRKLQNCDASIHAKIQKLVQSGLLQVQR